MREKPRLKGKGEFPPTETLLELIYQRGYTSIRGLCKEEGYKRSSFQDDLKLRGQRDKNMVLDALDDNKDGFASGVGEAMVNSIDPRDKPEDTTYYTQQDVEDLLKYEKERNTALARQNRKLQGQLFDRNEGLKALSAETRRAMQGIGLAKPKPRMDPQAMGMPGDPIWVCHAPQADIHAGKYVWGKEAWGEDYDTDLACERIVWHARSVARWIERQYGVCREIFFTDLGDLFHALDGKTEAGTILHQDTRARRVYRHTLQAKYEAVDILREVVPKVTLLQSRGNHDYLWHDLFFQSVAARYDGLDDVDVRISFKPASYFVVGEAVHVLDHGKGLPAFSSPKTRGDVWTTIQNTVPAEDLYKNNKQVPIYFYIGHLHYREVYEHNNLEIIRLPAITEPDDYEQSLRLHSRPGAIAYRLHGAAGTIEDEHRIYF